MNEHETHIQSNAERKAKIRERYKGIDREELEVIPAIKELSLQEDESEKRVGVYARVSTDDPNQTSSYELQKNHFQDMVNRHPGWKLVEIYADEGISGTSLNHRDSFNRMIADCEAGKLDLIITKSVSRFARNVLDCIGQVRNLAALPHPVGVLFETENLYTLNRNSEMALSFISTLAQEESHNKSDIMNASVEMRFSRGIFLTPALLGYDLDEEGNLVVNEEEALTVRLIFFMYLYGYSTTAIAELLTKLERRTKRGNTRWSAGSVLQVLQNERHCGEVLAHKTWTPNYLNHKSVKNRQNRPQYRKRNHHEAIISRDDFIAVQSLITNAKFGHKGYLPSIQVIETGALRGFVAINTKWSGFDKQDYFDAVKHVCGIDPDTPSPQTSVRRKPGPFDLSGFEIARGQYFQGPGDVSVTFSIKDIQFSKTCIRKFDNVDTVELLFDPIRKLFAVRPTGKDNRHGVKWARLHDHDCSVLKVHGTAFLSTLFDILGWKPENKYRIFGVRRVRGAEVVLLFDLHEVEVYIPITIPGTGDSKKGSAFEVFEQDVTPISAQRKGSVVAYPEDWATGFGQDYYQQQLSPELRAIDHDDQWDVTAQGKPYNPNEVTPTPPHELREGIQNILTTINQGGGMSNE